MGDCRLSWLVRSPFIWRQRWWRRRTGIEPACAAPRRSLGLKTGASQDHGALLALTRFPQAIVPNPLVAEMTALATQAGLSVPLTEEVAADIFMGTFTEKWRRAAAVASRSLEGRCTRVATTFPARTPGPSAGRAGKDSHRWGKKTAEDFSALCAARAAEARAPEGQGRYVAANGTSLEQAQILTTHNLAQLVDALNLREQIAAAAPELADCALSNRYLDVISRALRATGGSIGTAASR